jgi:ribosomal-protein-alanine N-acetyltransferase
MNSQTAIRRMTLADLDAVVALDRLSFSDPWPYSAWRGMLEDPHARVWVVETQEIIGALAIWLILDELHIGTIAVHPDHQRQGIGAALLEVGLRAGMAEGAKLAHLEVRKSNLSAQRLYERFGFKIVGERKRYYADNREDAILMSVFDLGEAYG